MSKLPHMIDKPMHIANRNRAYAHHKDFSFLFEAVMDLLTERLQDTAYRFEDGLILECFGTLCCDILAGKGLLGQKINRITQMDCAINFARHAKKMPICKHHHMIVADAEFMPFADETFDVVLSPFHLHWMNDLVGTLIQIKQILREDGAFFAVMPGGKTLQNIRHAMMQAEIELYGGGAPHILPFVDIQTMGQLMQRAGFALPVIDSEVMRINYKSVQKLCADLRYMGEGNALSERRKQPYGKAFFQRVETLMEAQKQDGFFTIEIELIFLHGWKPSVKQRKALKPGSGQISLDDVL